MIVNQFGGLAPKIAPRQLPAQMAVVACNCRFGSGALEPWHAPEYVTDVLKVGGVKSIFRYAGQFWLSWLEEVSVTPAPVARDAFGRIYWTGEGYPRVGGAEVVTSGGTGIYPAASYRLGLPAPVLPPVTTVTGTADELATPNARAYVYTYVSAYGEEGPPSDPSAPVEIASGQALTVTLPGTAPDGNYNVTQVRLYRTDTGTSSTEYLYVATLAVTTTTFDDTVAGDALSEVLPSLEWSAPPDDLMGLCDHPMGSLAGFADKLLLLSVPYQPHAWPYRYATTDPIVAIGVYGTSILVTTTGKPYVVSGSDPSAMMMERLEKGEACLSRRGFVDMGLACVYPGPSGLWGAGMGDIALLTEKILTAEQWAAYAPETLLGAHYNQTYLGFYDTGSTQAGFVFDPLTGDWTDLDIFATAAWTDPNTGQLFLVVDNKIVEWNGSGTLLPVTWRSKPFPQPGAVNPGAAVIRARQYPLTFRLFGDDVLRHERQVTSSMPFRLPGGYRAETLAVEIEGQTVVDSVELGGSVNALIRGGV